MLKLVMIPRFDIMLLNKFNHLMFADDLILISNANRSITHNVNTCFSIYFQLSGQRPNSSKPTIYFLDWSNKKLSRGILVLF